MRLIEVAYFPMENDLSYMTSCFIAPVNIASIRPQLIDGVRLWRIHMSDKEPILVSPTEMERIKLITKET